MLKSFDEMTPDQQLAYKMGYEAARSELRVAGPDDLVIRREDIDYRAAAKALAGILLYWQWSSIGPQGGHETEAVAAGIVDAALGLAATEGEEEE